MEPPSLAYPIYENYPTNKMTIHIIGECMAFERRMADETDNGRWHGPFQRREWADEKAESAVRCVRECKKCFGLA